MATDGEAGSPNLFRVGAVHSMPKIKKHRNRNQYLLTNGGLWVRDFNQVCQPIDINNLTSCDDFRQLMQNEMDIRAMQIPEIGSEFLPTFPKVIIVSDGYDFNKKKHILYDLPSDVRIIATNRVLAKWDVSKDGTVKRKIDFYFVSNPYNECMSFLPSHNYRPRCICSIRTNPLFLKKYKGTCFYYIPTGDLGFGRKRSAVKSLDDYRNPICGAVSIAHRCNVRKLAFMCCDDVMKEGRPTMEQLSNGLWTYPQHHIMHQLLDGQVYWLKQQEDYKIEVVDHSSGPKYENISYIELDKLVEFFDDN